MEMDWSPQQQEALDKVGEWLKDPSGIFRLFGYAGTGKTTLAKHFAEIVNGQVLFGAYTGKAALVLKEKGCYNASTIHRLIYLPKQKSQFKLQKLKEQLELETDPFEISRLEIEIFKEEKNLKRPSFSLNFDSDVRFAKLLILDEVSMVGKTIGEDIASFGTPVLALGDPAQLPPVRDGGFYTNCQPNYMLTNIHRQAEESPIIDLATKVRHGEQLSIGIYGESNVIPKGRLTIDEIAAYDQIIVGKNATRKAINRRIRREVLKRETHLPEKEDLLICLKNNYNNGLLNGSQWYVMDVVPHADDEDLIDIQICNYDDPDKYSFWTTAFRHYFEDRQDAIKHYEMGLADHFDFGYAITCHKAQGSQWKNVCVVDESYCFNGNQDKWLYTAITRASEKVTVIQ